MANAKQVALVTGASSGMGKVIARRLIRDGLTVIVAARRVEQMADLKALGAYPTPYTTPRLDTHRWSMHHADHIGMAHPSPIPIGARSCEASCLSPDGHTPPPPASRYPFPTPLPLRARCPPERANFLDFHFPISLRHMRR